MRGGFAAALRVGPEQGSVLLRELRRDVVHRDIVSRHSLRTARPLMTFALHLLAHPRQPRVPGLEVAGLRGPLR